MYGHAHANTCMHVQACLLYMESVPVCLSVCVCYCLETFIKHHVSGLKTCSKALRCLYLHILRPDLFYCFPVWVDGLMNHCCLVKHWLSGANELVKWSTSEVDVVTQCLCHYGWCF